MDVRQLTHSPSWNAPKPRKVYSILSLSGFSLEFSFENWCHETKPWYLSKPETLTQQGSHVRRKMESEKTWVTETVFPQLLMTRRKPNDHVAQMTWSRSLFVQTNTSNEHMKTDESKRCVPLGRLKARGDPLTRGGKMIQKNCHHPRRRCTAHHVGTVGTSL